MACDTRHDTPCQSRHHFCLNFDFDVSVGVARTPRKRNSQKFHFATIYLIVATIVGWQLKVLDVTLFFFTRSLATRIPIVDAVHSPHTSETNKIMFHMNDCFSGFVSIRFNSWGVKCGRTFCHAYEPLPQLAAQFIARCVINGGTEFVFISEEILIFLLWFIWPRETCLIGARRLSRP